MQSRLLDDRDGGRVFAVILETNEEFPEIVVEFARARGIKGAWITGLGAFSEATVSFWDPATREYLPIRIDQQVEVLSLVGNIALMPDGDRRIHAHVVLGDRAGDARGGHLVKARVHPTLEVFVTETREAITRKVDEATGLPLIRFDPSTN